MSIETNRRAAGAVMKLFGLSLTFAAGASAAEANDPLSIPGVTAGSQRLITVEDVVALRDIDVLSVSSDRKHYAIFVHQGDVKANNHRTGLFVSGTQGGALVPVGDGGTLKPAQRPTGHVTGELTRPILRWSPDGQWIAYTVERNDEIQIWRSRVDGVKQEQVTHNSADVRDFVWSDDGQSLYFTTGSARAELLAREKQRSEQGYRYDEDLLSFTQFLLPRHLPPEPERATWTVALTDGHERMARPEERAAYERTIKRLTGGTDDGAGFIKDAAVPPVRRADGAPAGLERMARASRHLQVVASLSPDGSNVVKCEAQACKGMVSRVWWSADGRRVYFQRQEGVADHATAFYAWSPATGKVTLSLRSPDHWRFCDPIDGDRVICARETRDIPPHVALLDLRFGAVTVIADLNPEFRNIRLGKSERYEFDNPKLPWNEPGGALAGLYAARGYGYILYPPDFDPRKTYPVFIEPYRADGFERAVGGEHALHVYAAEGFIVLNLSFPAMNDIGARLGANVMLQLYSAELGFPHLTMWSEGTLRALDAAQARGFIDGRRTGIGGVSHGTFVPLFMMKNHDRITAISISSPTWGPHDYYWGTRALHRANTAATGAIGNREWRPNPSTAEGRAFWNQIDIAEHIDQIEGPVLMNLATGETYGLLKLITHLAEANRPYDTYVYPEETHLKWQPAHIHSIMTRNIDWFRFWLQDIEDPSPDKQEQYASWRELRRLQCENPRSLRDYCAVQSRAGTSLPD